MASFYLVLLGLIVAVNAAYALKCYECDSSESASCNYGLLSFAQSTKDCSEGEGFSNIIPKSCVKVVARNNEGKEYVARGCIPKVGSSICNALVKTAGFFSSLPSDGLETNCYTCDEDKCNSAQKMTGMTVFGLVLAIFAFLF